MVTNAYNFTRTDGTSLGIVHSMESNGPGAESVPIQIADIDYSKSPIEFVVRGDLTDRFPAAAVNRAPIVNVDVNNKTITFAGDYTYHDQLSIGNTIVVFSFLADRALSYTITGAYAANGNTTLYLDNQPNIDVAEREDSMVSTIRAIDASGTVGEIRYFVDEVGSTLDDGGNTHIPLHPIQPLISPDYRIIAATAGAGGTFIIDDAANGSCMFGAGSKFNVFENSLPAADKQYTVSLSETSGTYQIVTIAGSTITIAGDQRRFFVNNHKISIGGGLSHSVQLTVAGVALVDGNTTINVLESINETAATATSLVCYPTVTRIVVTNTIPNGVGTNGLATPSQPTSYAMSAPPAITPTTPHNFLITWRIAGDHAASFNIGCPILIRGNGYYEYQEFPVQSVSVSAGMTHIVTQVSEPTNITPSPDANGQVIYPAPIAPSGYIRYSTTAAFSPLKLIGKGSPSYNSTTTWGQALQDNTIALTENFASGLREEVKGVVVGAGGKFMLDKKLLGHNQLVAGGTFEYSADTSQTTDSVDPFTIASVDFDGTNINVVTVESIPATYVGNGDIVIPGVAPSNLMVGQQWYDKTSPQMYVTTSADQYGGEYHGVVVQTVPALELVDMGSNRIINLADAYINEPNDAVNVATADRMYIAKTGGSSNEAYMRSGTMTGSLNIGVLPGGAPDVLGFNVTNAPVRLYGSADIEFNASSSGNIHIAGMGSVLVDRGNVTVGDDTNNVIIQSHGNAAPTVTFTTDDTNNEVINLGSNKIINLSTPTQPLDAANKQYVDGLANGIVWLQPVLDPNLFADTLTSPPFIFGEIVAVTTGASNTFTVAGNFASKFTAGQILTVSGNAQPTANKSYTVVSAANVTANTAITVTPSTIPVGTSIGGTITDTSVPMHKTYIVKAPATGDWAGLDNHAVTYSVINIDPETQTQTWGWVDILGRAVAIGDRFGVFIEPDAEDPLVIMPAGELLDSAGKIATVASLSPLAYTFYTPTEPYAFSVTGTSPVLNTAAVNDKSPHFGHSYTFRGTWGSGDYGVNYKWIEFAGPSMLAAGGGLRYAGSVLNVGSGPGMIVNADSVQLDTSYVDGQYVRLNGAYPMSGSLSMGGNKVINVGAPSAGSDASNKTYVDNQDNLHVAKTGDVMSGSLSFTAGTVTGISNPTNNQDAATKVYTDNSVATRINRMGDTMNGSLVMSGVGVGITLPNDPLAGTDATNKTYVDTKLPLAGGTLTGPLILSGDPAVAMGASTKQYVDTTTVHRGTSTTLATDVSITFAGTGEVLGLPAVPSSNGSATSKAYVDGLLTQKPNDSTVVHLGGTETLTGSKTFSAATAFNNQVTVKADGVNTNVLVTTTDITLTGTPVSSGGASNITMVAGSNSAGSGGNVSLTGGNGATIGGNITIAGGQGSSGVGGNVTITTGAGSTNGQLALTAGSGSIIVLPSGALSIGGAVPTGKSQALVSNSTTPGTLTPTWQLVGTRVAAAPANSAAPGIIGNWFADDSYFYVYGATGWRRTAISTF